MHVNPEKELALLGGALQKEWPEQLQLGDHPYTLKASLLFN